MSLYKVNLAKDKTSLAIMAKEVIRDQIVNSLSKKKQCNIALAGGSTPAATYKLLSREKLEWKNVNVFLGDERWVSPSSEMSNTFMIRKTLLSNSPGNQANFFSIPTTDCQSPEESAKVLHEKINKISLGSVPVFDLIVLGLGDDGHTASLFPWTNATSIDTSWAISTKGGGIDRISLTVPVLSAADMVVFMVSGSNKRLALSRLLDKSEPIDRTPAKSVRPASQILVLADQEAYLN